MGKGKKFSLSKKTKSRTRVRPSTPPPQPSTSDDVGLDEFDERVPNFLDEDDVDEHNHVGNVNNDRNNGRDSGGLHVMDSAAGVVGSEDEEGEVEEQEGELEDEDGSESSSPSMASSSAAVDDAKISFLLRYEQLIRQQDAETVAVVGHLLPLFERLRHLGGDALEGGVPPTQDRVFPTTRATKGNDERSELGGFGARNSSSSDPHLDFLSFRGMKRALEILDEQDEYGGPSGVDQASNGIGMADESDVLLLTDRQLMMVLRELTTACDEEVMQEGSVVDAALSFPEFLQCYRAVVGGMQALEMIPPRPAPDPLSEPDGNRDVGEAIGEASAGVKGEVASMTAIEATEEVQRIKIIRESTTERVRQMIRTFGVSSPSSIRDNGSGMDSGGSGKNKSHDHFSAEEMKKILTAKDRQFVRLMEGHAEELDRLAYQIRALESSRRRRTVTLTAGVSFVFFVSFVFVSRRPTPTTSPRVVDPPGAKESPSMLRGVESLSADVASYDVPKMDYLALAANVSEGTKASWSEQRTFEVCKSGEKVELILTSLQNEFSLLSVSSFESHPRKGKRVDTPPTSELRLPKDWLDQLRHFSVDAVGAVRQMDYMILASSKQMNELKKEKTKLSNALDLSKKDVKSMHFTVENLLEDVKRKDASMTESSRELGRCWSKLKVAETNRDKGQESDRSTQEQLDKCLQSQEEAMDTKATSTMATQPSNRSWRVPPFLLTSTADEACDATALSSSSILPSPVSSDTSTSMLREDGRTNKIVSTMRKHGSVLIAATLGAVAAALYPMLSVLVMNFLRKGGAVIVRLLKLGPR